MTIVINPVLNIGNLLREILGTLIIKKGNYIN